MASGAFLGRGRRVRHSRVLVWGIAAVLLASQLAGAQLVAEETPEPPPKPFQGPPSPSPRPGAKKEYIALLGPGAGILSESSSTPKVVQQLATDIGRFTGDPSAKLNVISGMGLNAVIFSARETAASSVRSMAGVVSVEEVVPRKLLARHVVPRIAQAQTCGRCDDRGANPSTTSEAVPYGIPLVQANDADFLAQTGGPQAKGVTVCILDTGLDTRHPDLRGSGNSLDGFAPRRGSRGDLYQWNSTLGQTHGVHVAGTVAAPANGQGVVGVIGGGASIFHVNLFGNSGSTSSALILRGLQECERALVARQQTDPSHRMVLSMSLGGYGSSTAEAIAYANLYNRGDMLIVAAAGNDGARVNNFPAAYSPVVSVAAVDCSSNRAYFSSYNDDVELAAPGLATLSTVPTAPAQPREVRSLIVGTSDGATTPFNVYKTDGGLARPLATVTGSIVDCGSASSACPAAVRNNICLIDRGTPGSPVLCSRVRTCMAAGAKAVLVVANGCDAAGFTLNCRTFDTRCTCSFRSNFVPSSGVSSADGATIRGMLGSITSATLQLVSNQYAIYSGTSMATPHVSGVAAKLWNSFRGCSNAVIRQALAETAEDLGPTGRDAFYGHGLIQAKAAAEWLSGQSCA